MKHFPEDFILPSEKCNETPLWHLMWAHGLHESRGARHLLLAAGVGGGFTPQKRAAKSQWIWGQCPVTSASVLSQVLPHFQFSQYPNSWGSFREKKHSVLPQVSGNTLPVKWLSLSYTCSIYQTTFSPHRPWCSLNSVIRMDILLFFILH